MREYPHQCQQDRRIKPVIILYSKSLGGVMPSGDTLVRRCHKMATHTTEAGPSGSVLRGGGR